VFIACLLHRTENKNFNKILSVNTTVIIPAMTLGFKYHLLPRTEGYMVQSMEDSNMRGIKDCPVQ